MNDMPDCSNMKNRKARKDHKCTNCGDTISKGTVYSYISGIWNGEPESFKHCKNCETVFENFKVIDDGLGYEDGPTLDRGGIACWLQDFFYVGFHGIEAAKEYAKLFDLPLDYFLRILKINDESRESESL